MDIEDQEENAGGNTNSFYNEATRAVASDLVESVITSTHEEPVIAANANGVEENTVRTAAENRNGAAEENAIEAEAETENQNESARGDSHVNPPLARMESDEANVFYEGPPLLVYASGGEESQEDEDTNDGVNAVPVIGREEVVEDNVLDEMQVDEVGGDGARGGGERRDERRRLAARMNADWEDDSSSSSSSEFVDGPFRLPHDDDDDDDLDFPNINRNQISQGNNIPNMEDSDVHREIDGIMRSDMRDNFMQRMRRALYSIEHRRRRLQRAHLGDTQRSNSDTDETEEGNGGVPVEPENPIRFDTNLPAEHSYLGANMNRVSGVNYLDVGQEYKMMLFMHSRVILPGEVFPFIIPASFVESDIDAQNGLMLGICFPYLLQADSNGVNNIYGVTCQIYEKGLDGRTNAMVKSRALQRFVTNNTKLSGPLQQIASTPQYKCFGNVKILPEIYLPSPLNCINMGSMNRFRGSAYMKDTFKRYQAATTPWPAHVYDYYSIEACLEQARERLAQHKIDNMPTNPVQLSFWLVRNLHFQDSVIKDVFLTDSVNTRMKLISSTLKKNTTFTCRYCAHPIAKCSELFAMNKHGVQTQYCNSSGYIHETNTVYHLLGDAIKYSGQPSSEFSWFPGYKWHIVVCRMCARHIGWKFRASLPNLLPKKFYGISSSSVRVSNASIDSTTDPRAVIYRSFMHLARREMQ